MDYLSPNGAEQRVDQHLPFEHGLIKKSIKVRDGLNPHRFVKYTTGITFPS